MSVLVNFFSGGSGHTKVQGPNLNSGWVVSWYPRGHWFVLLGTKYVFLIFQIWILKNVRTRSRLYLIENDVDNNDDDDDNNNGDDDNNNDDNEKRCRWSFRPLVLLRYILSK